MSGLLDAARHLAAGRRCQEQGGVASSPLNGDQFLYRFYQFEDGTPQIAVPGTIASTFAFSASIVEIANTIIAIFRKRTSIIIRVVPGSLRVVLRKETDLFQPGNWYKPVQMGNVGHHQTKNTATAKTQNWPKRWF
ncbi:hypothetical protein Dda_6905 [Drechslerella dactyloides]|uniref:Uncharacterized protein n=1 Tax=Drechslerella dactyloides TaxID=74499 RepID=A0AAD6NIM4_DREDA|nr:hypothetical protein Dda_6905 [Drechslerella dactyloides]